MMLQDEIDALLRLRLLDEVGDRGRVGRGAAKPVAGRTRLPTIEADDQREGRDDLEIDQRLDADAADLLASWICAMPETTVQKMIGAITILISLMKPSPSALIQSLVARSGHSQPTTTPSTIAISTCT